MKDMSGRFRCPHCENGYVWIGSNHTPRVMTCWTCEGSMWVQTNAEGYIVGPYEEKRYFCSHNLVKTECKECSVPHGA